MTETAILAASGLLLFAYLVDIVGRRWLGTPGLILSVRRAGRLASASFASQNE